PIPAKNRNLGTLETDGESESEPQHDWAETFAAPPLATAQTMTKSRTTLLSLKHFINLPSVAYPIECCLPHRCLGMCSSDHAPRARDNRFAVLDCRQATVNSPSRSDCFSLFCRVSRLVMVSHGEVEFTSPVPISQLHPSLKSLRFAAP